MSIEPAAVARHAILAHERERIRHAPRAREQPTERQVAVAGNHATRRIGQAHRRAQPIEVVVIRPARRDLAHQPQAIGVAGDQAARAVYWPTTFPSPVGSTRLSVIWPLWIVATRLPRASYS